MALPFSEVHGNAEYRYPAFKFLSQQHADALINRGNVYVPSVNTFTDRRLVGGTIYDECEGVVVIENEYTFYSGLAKDADGLIPVCVPAYQSVAINRGKLRKSVTSNRVHAYCMTQYMLSDSFAWAVNESGKDACVMIKDVDAFLEAVAQQLAANGLNYSLTGECLYHADEDGCVREVDPTRASLTNYLFSSPPTFSLIKRKSFANQRELRAVWLATADNLPNVPIDEPAVRNSLMRIDFSRVDSTLYFSRDGAALPLRCELHYNNGEAPEHFTIREPRHVFSPIFFKPENGQWQFGLWNKNEEVFANMDFAGMRIMPIIHIQDDRQIMCPRPMDTIDHIEFAFPA